MWRPSASRIRSERTLPPPSAIAPPSACSEQRADDLGLARAEGLLAVALEGAPRSASPARASISVVDLGRLQPGLARGGERGRSSPPP